MDEPADILLPSFLATSVSFLAVRLRNEFRVRLYERYDREGLRPTHGAILICLEADPPITQKGLSELLRMDPSDAVRLLDELEQIGFVQRMPDPADRRRKLLVLTPTGVAQAVRCRAIAVAAEDELLSVLSQDDRQALRSMLVRVISAVDTRIRVDQLPVERERTSVR